MLVQNLLPLSSRSWWKISDRRTRELNSSHSIYELGFKQAERVCVGENCLYLKLIRRPA